MLCDVDLYADRTQPLVDRTRCTDITLSERRQRRTENLPSSCFSPQQDSHYRRSPQQRRRASTITMEAEVSEASHDRAGHPSRLLCWSWKLPLSPALKVNTTPPQRHTARKHARCSSRADLSPNYSVFPAMILSRVSYIQLHHFFSKTFPTQTT
jgi:hypothetical protein